MNIYMRVNEIRWSPLRPFSCLSVSGLSCLFNRYLIMMTSCQMSPSSRRSLIRSSSRRFIRSNSLHISPHTRNKTRSCICMSCGSTPLLSIPKICIMDIACIGLLSQTIQIACLIHSNLNFFCFTNMTSPYGFMSYNPNSIFYGILCN